MKEANVQVELTKKLKRIFPHCYVSIDVETSMTRFSQSVKYSFVISVIGINTEITKSFNSAEDVHIFISFLDHEHQKDIDRIFNHITERDEP